MSGETTGLIDSHIPCTTRNTLASDPFAVAIPHHRSGVRTTTLRTRAASVTSHMWSSFAAKILRPRMGSVWVKAPPLP